MLHFIELKKTHVRIFYKRFSNISTMLHKINKHLNMLIKKYSILNPLIPEKE